MRWTAPARPGAAHLRRLDRQIAARFLDPAVKGCWIERIDARGGSCGATPRLSTLSSLVSVCGLRDALAHGGERPLAFANERRAGHAA